jgi:hypothetical protein
MVTENFSWSGQLFTSDRSEAKQWREYPFILFCINKSGSLLMSGRRRTDVRAPDSRSRLGNTLAELLGWLGGPHAACTLQLIN